MLTLPAASATPFFSSVPRALLVADDRAGRLLETAIASQAMISGAFPFVVQSIQLELDNLPRVRVVHTSASEQAQVLRCRFSTACSWRCRSRSSSPTDSPCRRAAAPHLAAGPSAAAARLSRVLVVVTIAWRLGRRWKRAARIGAGAVTLDAFCEQFVVKRADIPRVADRVGVFATAHVDAIPVEFVRFVEFAHTVVFLTIAFDAVLRFGFAEHEHDVRHVLIHSPAFPTSFFISPSRALSSTPVDRCRTAPSPGSTCCSQIADLPSQSRRPLPIHNCKRWTMRLRLGCQRMHVLAGSKAFDHCGQQAHSIGPTLTIWLQFSLGSVSLALASKLPTT